MSGGSEHTARYDASAMRVVSVIVATYNRSGLLCELLDDLNAQQLPAGWDLQVVVSDDGSTVPVAPALHDHPLGDQLVVLTQANAGPSAARHHAIQRSRGEVLLCVDDDMRVEPEFVARHLRHHEAGADVVLGRIDDAHDGVVRPLFHRLHQRFLDAKVDSDAGQPARGVELFTGNVSFRADCYRDVGGFDVTLRRCEDRDLGIRFDQAGYRIVGAPDAPARHFSDHHDVAGWRRRTIEWGALDQAISERRGASAPSPWQVLGQLPGPFGPIAIAAALAPRLFGPLAGAAYRAGEALARVGLEGPALQAAAVTYGVDYFRGVGRGAPGRRAILRAARRRRGTADASAPHDEAGATGARRGPLAAFAHAVCADHATSRRYRARYQDTRASAWQLPFDAVTKVGFQMLIAVRVMRLLRDLRVPFGAQLLSRLIRHVYGAEIHWDAELAPGLVVVHGNGLVISADAEVGRDCILFQHVTLGRSLDAASGVHGAPTLCDGVHVGPGAVVLGPVIVGERAKIVANSVVLTDIPAGMVARPAPVEIVPTRLRAVECTDPTSSDRAAAPDCGPSTTTTQVRGARS